MRRTLPTNMTDSETDTVFRALAYWQTICEDLLTLRAIDDEMIAIAVEDHANIRTLLGTERDQT